MSSAPQKRLEKARRKLLKAEYKRITTSPPPSISDLTAILHEVYDTYFPNPKDYATYHMLYRYKEKLSPEGYSKLQSLRSKGRKGSKAMWRTIVYSDNPFLSLLPR